MIPSDCATVTYVRVPRLAQRIFWIQRHKSGRSPTSSQREDSGLNFVLVFRLSRSTDLRFAPRIILRPSRFSDSLAPRNVVRPPSDRSTDSSLPAPREPRWLSRGISPSSKVRSFAIPFLGLLLFYNVFAKGNKDLPWSAFLQQCLYKRRRGEARANPPECCSLCRKVGALFHRVLRRVLLGSVVLALRRFLRSCPVQILAKASVPGEYLRDSKSESASPGAIMPPVSVG